MALQPEPSPERRLGVPPPAIGHSSADPRTRDAELSPADEPAWSDLLALIAPGFVHQFGNLLFTIQGNAQLASVVLERERDAILRATERGAETVRLLRSLFGDPSAKPIALDELLGQITELARVAVRERGRQLLLAAPQTPCALHVDLRSTGLLVLLGLQQFLRALPTVADGVVVLERVQAQGKVTLRIGLVASSGQLPFPLPQADLLASLARRAGQLGLSAMATVSGHHLELHMPADPVTAAPQA